MALEDEQASTRLHVPRPKRAVVRPRKDTVSVAAPCAAINGVLVCELALARAAVQIPDPHRAIVGAGEGALLVRAPDHSFERARMTFESLQAVSALHVPELNGAAPGSRQSTPPVGAQRSVNHEASVPV